MILLNSIPAEYFVVKNALQYTGIVPKIELIVSGLKVRELELNANRKTGNNLYAKGKRILMSLIIQEVQVLKTNIEIKLVNKSLNGNVIIVGRRDILKSTVMTILESKNKRVVHL